VLQDAAPIRAAKRGEAGAAEGSPESP
jgi:hypothetical protein